MISPRYWPYLVFLVIICLVLGGCGLFVERLPQGHIVSPTPHDHFITIGDVNFHYVEYPGTGENIFFLHGFASSTYTWEGVAPYFQRKGYHVWALDMKGFGWSDKPEGSKYDPVSLMEEVHAWMNTMGLRNVTFVGNSLGGAIATLMAIEHPETIKKMVLIDAAGYAMKKPLVIRMASVPFSDVVMKLIFGRWLIRWNLKEVFYHDDRVTEEKIDAYFDRMRTENALDAQVSVARSVDAARFENYIERIPGITAATLIIWGKNDPWIPLDIGYRFREDLADSTMIIIPECGHMPQEEYPGITARVIGDFIEGTMIREPNVEVLTGKEKD